MILIIILRNFIRKEAVMKKNVEMISLNLGSMNFEEKMDLDEVLERLNPIELESVKAGACSPNCGCYRMTSCSTRCDADCIPLCNSEQCYEMSCSWDGWS